MKKEIRNPYWTNNARTVLSADFVYSDGRVITATINPDANNPDWNEIQSKFSADQLERNTQAMIRKINGEKEAVRKREQASREKKRQEELFAFKLNAFEVDAVKNSTNRELKSALRRSKSQIEVYAFATAIILDEHNKAQQAIADAEQTEE